MTASSRSQWKRLGDIEDRLARISLEQLEELCRWSCKRKNPQLLIDQHGHNSGRAQQVADLLKTRRERGAWLGVEETHHARVGLTERGIRAWSDSRLILTFLLCCELYMSKRREEMLQLKYTTF